MKPHIKQKNLYHLFFAISLLMVALVACTPAAQVTPTSTTAPTEAATEEAAEEPTEEATEEVAEEPTEEVAEELTEEATEEAAEEPTEDATVEVAAVPTEVETEEVAEEPTEEMTEAAEEPTEEMAEEPTEEAAEEEPTEVAAVATEAETEEAAEEPTEEATEESAATEAPTSELDEEAAGTATDARIDQAATGAVAGLVELITQTAEARGQQPTATEAAEETEEAAEEPTEEAAATPLPVEEVTEEATEEATAEATSEAGAGAEIAWECPESARGGNLNVLNWSGYIGENTIAEFERLCDVTVTYDIFDSNESLMARMRQGNAGYDVAFPNEFAVSIMAREGLIQPIDVSQIPNFANASEQWVGLSFDPNNEYSVPYLWGTFGILYDRDKTGKDIETWEDFFTYEGSVAWVDDTHSLLGTALQQLGYDPNTTVESEVMEARDYLIANSSNVRTITSDPGPLFAGGEFDMITTYSGDAYQIISDCGCDNYRYVVPAEGSVGDITNMVLLTGAPNPEVAIAFMDYIMDPVVNAQIVNDVIYATANQTAVDSGLIDPDILNNPAIWPQEEALASLWFTEDLGDAEFYYSDAWDEVLVGVGGGN